MHRWFLHRWMKFGDEPEISSHILWLIWLYIQAGIMVNPCQYKGPMVINVHARDQGPKVTRPLAYTSISTFTGMHILVWWIYIRRHMRTHKRFFSAYILGYQYIYWGINRAFGWTFPSVTEGCMKTSAKACHNYRQDSAKKRINAIIAIFKLYFHATTAK